MSEPVAANVHAMLPTFPKVRCDKCRKVYTVPTDGPGPWVFGSCPHCGAERFSTTMPATPGIEPTVIQMSPCRCEPWAQRWKAETPERCANCGGLFDPKTVPARRPMPGDPA